MRIAFTMLLFCWVFDELKRPIAEERERREDVERWEKELFEVRQVEENKG